MGNVALGRRAYTVIRRHPLQATICAALLALCVICCAAASTAPAATRGAGASAKGASSHASAPAKRHRRRRGCAKRASFHSVSKPTGSHRKLHRKRHAGCRRKRHARRHRHHRTAAHHTSAPLSSYAAPVPVNGVCAGSELRPTAEDLDAVRSATLCLVNRERLAHGESALKPNQDLQTAAQGHSEDMWAGDYFEHDGRHGDTPLSRMRAAGYIFSTHVGYAVGENIAWATLWMATPKAIVSGWMASPGHRANILDATFQDTGIGVSPHGLASLARGQAGAIYTQDFGRIITP
jgi:uncharacterized protein YkwD